MWPKANDKEAWRSFEADLVPVLQNSLRGSLESKVKLLEHIIYEEGAQSFGEKHIRSVRLKQNGRHEGEIHQLLKERHLLRKAWRKAKEEEKEEIRARLAHLG